jgi:hypothetical protein
MQNVMVVRTMRSIDLPHLIFNTEPAAKPSKFGSASEDSAAVILRNQDNSLTKLAHSAAGTYFCFRFYRPPLTLSFQDNFCNNAVIRVWSCGLGKMLLAFSSREEAV